jgi:transaldolase
MTSALGKFGTSIWLDDLSRAKISGVDLHSLPHRIKSDGVVGVTTNPSIFSAAISGSQDYAADIAALSGASVEEIITKLTTDDVREACDLFTEIYQSSKGADGRVSIEVDPRSAHETEKTISEGLELYRMIGRPNVMIKVPATFAGLPAITALISAGISVNVTLIFSLTRYQAVISAFMAGLEERIARGESISEVHSVASFFISRIDSAIDPILEKSGHTELLGKAAVANAHLAYELYLESVASERWKAIASNGGNMQRPLWASTGVKNPAYEDTRYVVELVAENCVNTMPQSTLDALNEHGLIRGDTISGTFDEARAVITDVERAGVSMEAITHDLEVEGVEKFADAWGALLKSVQGAIK